ncbi:SH3 domain-containing kinase-binding protein 1 [Geodia barretti]|uniref:SH3 domain-containing kinase-binding protein 1 n=1 Tax=Geodia barretti TaxID=519541 RepID=A0AA35WT78_GEOBA|nr:SH3 domain-containing kinase-binding protein 1 [Geodia barretti]
MEAVVLYDYEKQQGDELNLKVGEVITNVTQVYHGWCEGTKDGERGVFPDNFVKMRPTTEDVPSPAEREQQSEKTTPPTEPASGESTDTGEMPKGQRGRVLYRFEAEGSDEISLEPGQIVDVLSDEGDGWGQGRIGENEGYIPLNYVQLLDFTHPQATETPPLVTPTESASGEDIYDNGPGSTQYDPFSGM